MEDRLNFCGEVVWRGSGLHLHYGLEGMLGVRDLNPETKIKTRVSRWEMFRLGLWFIRRSFA